MNEIRIPYKPNKILFVLVVAFFGFCAAYIGNIAATNDRGLILNRIIEFSSQGATIFYWVMSILTLALAVVGIFALAISVFSNREIVITNSLITCPKGAISKKQTTVNFSDITGIYIQTIQKTRILNIEHIGGKLSIPNSMLPNNACFEQLISTLNARANS